MRRPYLRRSRRLVAILTLLLLSGCSLPLANHSRSAGSADRQGLIPMSAEKRYAGEVLAYMMRVVLGQAGDLKRRKEWRHRGLGQPLDLDWIEAVMDHPERSKKDLIVMDAGLIGLSEVLYDYNPRLNLFKGRYTFHSPYPSAELIALRLLLLGKLDRGETLTLSAMVQNEAALVAEGGGLPVVKLTEMGLNADEADLLRDVFRREPDFRWYYKSPPLVAAMDAMGLLTPERFVERLARAHDDTVWHRVDAPTAPSSKSETPMVRVAVLPSLIPGYRADRRDRLAPPEDVVDTFVKLKATLEKAVAVKRGRSAASESLEIQLYLGGPFVLHPQNAVHQLSRLCPDADLAVIVLGRNVYRAMDLSAAIPSASSLHPWYLDILDLKYDQATAEIDAIAAAVADRF